MVCGIHDPIFIYPTLHTQQCIRSRLRDSPKHNGRWSPMVPENGLPMQGSNGVSFHLMLVRHPFRAQTLVIEGSTPSEGPRILRAKDFRLFSNAFGPRPRPTSGVGSPDLAACRCSPQGPRVSRRERNEIQRVGGSEKLRGKEPTQHSAVFRSG